MIIWGSRGYFKRDHVVIYQTCGNCGTFGPKRCYSTTWCGHLYFIPLIPMGKKRVSAECTKCNMGRHAPLEQWEQLRDAELNAAMQAQREAPTDKDATLNALEAAQAFEHPVAFGDAAAVAMQNFSSDALVLEGIASGAAFFGNADEAEQRFGEALRVENSPKVQTSYANFLVDQGRNEDAEALLDLLVDSPPDNAAYGFLVLGERKQKAKDHASAVRYFDAAIAAMPTLAHDKPTQKMRQKSAKKL